MIPRRGLLAGLGAMLAAPAIIRTPGLLMPVRPVYPVWIGLDLGKDDRTIVGVSLAEWDAWIERIYANRSIRPFQGPDGPFYVAVRGEEA